MSLRRLTAFIILVELVALGVFMAFLLGWIYSSGGRVTLDITQFGEAHVEYLVMMAITAVAPYALYILDPRAGADN